MKDSENNATPEQLGFITNEVADITDTVFCRSFDRDRLSEVLGSFLSEAGIESSANQGKLTNFPDRL